MKQPPEFCTGSRNTAATVSNTALILGVAGANPPANTVLVAGLAGLIAGAVSMAAGEYVSMQAQKELIERELSVEAEAIKNHPESEHRELVRLYRSRGVDRQTAERMTTQVMADPELALEVHAMEELGLHAESIGSPWQGAGARICCGSAARQVPVIMDSVVPVVQMVGMGARLGVFMLQSPSTAHRPSDSLRCRQRYFHRAAWVRFPQVFGSKFQEMGPLSRVPTLLVTQS